MSKDTIEFVYEKETKNSVRFKEVPEQGKAHIIGSLYVQKWYVGDSKQLTLTLEKKS